jgi:SAM-dependent methyltransferase
MSQLGKTGNTFSGHQMSFRGFVKARIPSHLVDKLRGLEVDALCLRRRIGTVLGLGAKTLDDDLWFELQFWPQAALKYYGLRVPSLPPDEVQRRFTGMAGRENLQAAFSFYQHIVNSCKLPKDGRLMVLDFGCGWGRISRFFLRDAKPEHIWVSDVLTDAIHWLRETGNPCNIVQNQALPPIDALETQFDLIYAYSVFSHLSEPFLQTWLKYLMGSLRPGGHLVFTSRGRQFIDAVELLHRDNRPSDLRETLPHPDVLRDRYLRGEFQFYPTGGGGELTSDFYGEAFIPPAYLQSHFGDRLVHVSESVPHVNQSVFIMQREQS